MNNSEIWITHLSVKPWMSIEVWDNYLRDIEKILGDRITKLDSNDPARRKADTRKGEGEFMVNFGDKEDSRWLFGKFEKTKISFEVRHMKNGLDSFGHLSENWIQFYIPHHMSIYPDIEKTFKLFQMTNERLSPFYAYADYKNVICSKKPCTSSLDISTELLGIFWLTYFGHEYREFFGDKLEMIPGLEADPNGGVTLSLADTPAQVKLTKNEEIIKRLGPDSFASGASFKQRGKFALSIEQLFMINWKK